MKRRKFLSSAVQAVSVAAYTQLLPPELRAFSLLQSTASKASPNNSVRPQVALTMDDPTLSLGSILKWQEANARILKVISAKDVRAALFVCGMRVDDANGTKLVSAWDQAGHLICNHSYSHKFYGEQTSYADFRRRFSEK